MTPTRQDIQAGLVAIFVTAALLLLLTHAPWAGWVLISAASVIGIRMTWRWINEP